MAADTLREDATDASTGRPVSVRQGLIRPPRLRTEDGTEEGRRATWLELFFDLVFVAAVGQVGTHLEDHYSVQGLVPFSLLFVLIWFAWLGHTAYSTRFDTDDIVQRGLTLLQMFLVVVMAINATSALDSRDSAGFAAAYSVMRLVLVAQFLRARRHARARALATRFALSCGAAAALWLASALVPAPARFGIWAVALAIDMGTPLLTSPHLLRAPHDAAHLPERYGLFTIILLGEAMVAVMSGMAKQEYWSPGAAMAAMFGMMLVFALWWWYFDSANGAAERHIQAARDVARFHAWSYSHLPLYLGIAVAGVGIEHVIASAVAAPLPPTDAWILCSSVALAMVALAAIGRTGEGTRSGGAWAAVRDAGLPVTALLLGSVGTIVMPPVLIAALCALVITHLWLA